ncbi:MAG: hypothetical protein R3B13_01300 [Polyangiaceae bacterium]
MRCRASLWVWAVPMLVSLTANADPVPSVDLRNFHPPADPKGALYLEPTATPGPLAWNVGAIASYAYRMVTLQDPSGDRVSIPVEHQLSLDYIASLGIGDRLAVSLGLPSVLYQSGDDTSSTLADGTLPQTALGDASFGAKATMIPTSDLGGFGLAALGRVTFPTGDGRSYVADGSVTGELRLLAEMRLIALAVQATAGARVRGNEQSYVGEDFGHDLPWGLGLAVKPQAFGLDSKGRWTWVAEARGQIALTPSFGSGAQSPVLAGVSARYALGDLSLLAGAELPLNDAVGSPVVRGVLGLGWAPRFYDEDDDGVPDDKDECQELAEDRDGFEDHDGCPDFDNDDDGVPDDQDRCPTEQEDEDEYQDEDGCIDPDNDGDGVPDTTDACPDEAGPATGAQGAGCPVRDADGDGVLDGKDRCPDRPEDKDGFQDDDGCPDLDNDRDRVLDEDDACPLEFGAPRSDAKLNGCPSPDKDGDTYDDAQDKCVGEPEDFDGVDDDDGCPDPDGDKPAWQRAKPLLTVDYREQDKEARLKFRILPAVTATADGGASVEPKTLPSLRALAQVLNENPHWVALVGVKPGKGDEAEQQALNQSFAVVYALRNLTHRDEAAETIGWSAVKDQAGYGGQLGILVLAPPKPKGRLKVPNVSLRPTPAPAPAPTPAPPSSGPKP